MITTKEHNHSLHYISELNRRELVLKSLNQSPERVARSQEYHITGKMQINVDQFIFTDRITVEIPVNQYTCTIEFNNVIETIAQMADRQHRGNVNFDTVEAALNKALDDEKDLKVNCTCPDFYYRFSYVATKNGYKNGRKQRRPAPIRNPKDNKGSFCKHLLMILKNKKWVRKLASVVNYLIKEYYYDILQIYELDASNFYINRSGQHNDPVHGTRPQPGRSKLNKNTFVNTNDKEDDIDNEEELELRID